MRPWLGPAPKYDSKKLTTGPSGWKMAHLLRPMFNFKPMMSKKGKAG